MSEIPICFYIAPSARPAQQWAAIELSHKLGKKSRREWLNPRSLYIPDEVETAVVVGGDGSLRAVAEGMSRRKKPGVVLAVPAGSQNGSCGSLDRNGSSVALEDFSDVKPEDLRPFNPLRVNEHASLNLVAVGAAALTFCTVDESLRGRIPRGMKMPTAGIVAALQHAGNKTSEIDESQPLLLGFVAAPDYGGHEVFPGQEMFGTDEFTMVTISQMTKREAAGFCLKALEGIRRGGHFPDGLLQLKKSSREVFPHSDKKVNVGGDPLNLMSHTELTVFRDTHHPMYIAALSISNNRRVFG